MRNVNVDQIWRSIGPYGRYQWKQQISYFFLILTWAFQGLNIVFIGNRPPFHCKPSPNDTLMSNLTGIRKEYKECEIVSYTNTSEGVIETSTPCLHGWDYALPKDQSFVTEWDFVCQNAELGELTQTLYQVGKLVGTFVFPTLSDRLGRKPVFVSCHVAVFGIALGIAFSESYIVFVVLRVFGGLFAQGMLAGTTLYVETLPTEIRHYCAIAGLLTWTSSCALIAPIAYALRNYPWKYIQITYALFSASSLFQWWMTDESLRWVIANGQIDRAKEIIKTACKWNKKSYRKVMEKIGWGDLVDTDSKALVAVDHLKSKIDDDGKNNQTNMNAFVPQISGQDYPTRDQKNGNIVNDESDLDPRVKQELDQKDSNGEQEDGGFDKDEVEVRKYTVFDIFKHKRILLVSMIMWYTWLCDSFVYYGLYLTSAHLYGDRYINFFLSAILEYPLCLVQYLVLKRIGRKVTAVTGHSIGAVGLAVATGLTYTAGGNTRMLAAATAFTLIGKMGVTTGYNTVYLAAPELYPTNMRNIGLGMCSFMDKFGSMAAPFLRNVPTEIQWLPSCVFAIMCLITVLLLAFVPETNGVELPQTIEEFTEWYRVNKFELKNGKNRRAAKKTKENETDLQLET